MSWRTVHCSDPEGLDVELRPERHRPLLDGDWGGPTCKGPGPTRIEFVNATGLRDVRTTAECPRCDGRGGSHRTYVLVTLEQQGLTA